jgi:hypothetical protein
MQPLFCLQVEEVVEEVKAFKWPWESESPAEEAAKTGEPRNHPLNEKAALKMGRPLWHLVAACSASL